MTHKSLTLALETFGMEELSPEVTPENVVVRFTAKTLAAIDSYVELLNSDGRIKSLNLDLHADDFETTFIDEDGVDTELDWKLDCDLFLDACNKGSHLRVVLSGCGQDVEVGGVSCEATGEFFVNIEVADMRNLLQAN